ncbi:MAG: hypothetical protein AAFN12_18880, partial [Cyanobacteria bacterium J06560_2]
SKITLNVVLDAENFSLAERWTPLTSTAVAANEATGTPLRPSIAEVIASNDFVASNVAQALKATLQGQIYIIKPVELETPTLSVENLGQLLLEQRDNIIKLLANHSSDPEAIARYQVQLGQIEESLTKLGLSSPDGFGSADTLIVNLPDIYAAPGSIFIQANGGTSEAELETKRGKQLITSDRANIEIFNSLPFGMVVNDTVVRDNKSVVPVNGEMVTLQPGNLFLNNEAVGIENTAENVSEITITQKELFPNTRFNFDSIPDVPIDVFVEGDVVNESGNVTIQNFDGSINVAGEVRGEEVEIFAKGDFSLNTEGWFHTNRDPRQYLNFQGLKTPVRPVETDANPIKRNDPKRREFDASNVNQVVDNTGTTLQESIFRDSAKDPAAIFGATKAIKPGRILALGNIAITAQYLNVNGLIQSGVQNIEVTVDQDFINNVPSSGLSAFLDDNGNIRPGISFGEDVPVDGYYDPEQNAIVLDDLVPAGGNITLAGRLLSTGNAQLKVAHGYAGIDINNNTDKDLVLNRIDNTTNRKGLITLIDTARLVNGSTTQFKTEYLVTDEGIKREDFTGKLAPVTVNNPDGGTLQLNLIDYTPLGAAKTFLADELINKTKKVTWEPESGLFYVWTEGQESTRTIVTVYKKNSFNLFGTATPLARDIADKLAKDSSWSSRDIEYTDDQPLLESEDRVQVNAAVIPTGVDLSTIYAVEFERKEDTLVEVIPGSTIVKYVGTDTTKGVPNTKYLYKGDGRTPVDLLLPNVNYLDTKAWEAVGAARVKDYDS